LNKIVFLINSLSSGGAEKVLTVLTTELIRQKYKVEVIFLEKNEFYVLPKEVTKIYLSNLNGEENGFIKLFYIPILSFRLKRYIKSNNIKLIQSHLTRANYINLFSKVLKAKHTVQLVNHGIISRYQGKNLSKKMGYFLIKKLYPLANIIISISKGMQNDMQKIFDFQNKQIIINNPYNIEDIVKLSKEEVSEFKFKKNKKYLVSVGRLTALKRNHELINSLLKLEKDIEVLFLGDGNKRCDLEKLTNNLGLKNRVHFLGNVSNPYKFLSKCNILISCSESEGFSNILVEAMICDVPVISSDCIGGPREILAPNADNEYGLLFKVGDSKKMIEHIETLLANEMLSKQYIKKARRRASDFSVEKIVEEYKRLLLNE